MLRCRSSRQQTGSLIQEERTIRGNRGYHHQAIYFLTRLLNWLVWRIIFTSGSFSQQSYVKHIRLNNSKRRCTHNEIPSVQLKYSLSRGADFEVVSRSRSISASSFFFHPFLQRELRCKICKVLTQHYKACDEFILTYVNLHKTLNVNYV